MEWKNGAEGKAHTQAFADELKALMMKYNAELSLDETTVNFYGSTFDAVFTFDCCTNAVDCGNWTDGTNLKVR